MSNTHLRTDLTKARKEHRCDYCGLKIDIGVVYNKTVGIFDGDFYTFKAHLPCQELTSLMKMHDHEDDGVDGNVFYEYVSEEYYELTDSNYQTAKLIPFSERLSIVKQHYNLLSND